MTEIDDIKIVVDALKFYGNAGNYEARIIDGDVKEGIVSDDDGTKAREAMAALERVAAENNEFYEDATHFSNLAFVDAGANPQVTWKERAISAEAERDALREKLRMAQEALKFYAERMTYVSRSGMECGITRDNFGDNARAMIAEIEKVLK